jgi:hypothetical protein
MSDAVQTTVVVEVPDIGVVVTEDVTHIVEQVTDTTIVSLGEQGPPGSSTYTSSGIYASPSVTDNEDGTVTLGSGEYVFFSNAAGIPPLAKFTIGGGDYSFTDNSLNYIVADYNNGSPVMVVLTSTATINNRTVLPVLTVFRLDDHLNILGWGTSALALSNRLLRRFVRTQRFVVVPGGFMLGETATRTVTVTAGTIWYGINELALASYTSATDELSLYAHVAGVWTRSFITQYDNSQYDNGTDLQSLTGSHYAVNWVFRGATSNRRECFIVLGGGNYTITQAAASMVPADLPPEIALTSVLIGRIIVRNGESSAIQIESAFMQHFSLEPASNHANLTNLDWENSGHTGTANTVPVFDEDGFAAEAAWKLGAVQTTTGLTLSTTDYVELEIGGIPLKLAIVV